MKVFNLLLILSVVLGIGLIVCHADDSSVDDDILLDNIEALAEIESDDYDCIDLGSIECIDGGLVRFTLCNLREELYY